MDRRVGPANPSVPGEAGGARAARLRVVAKRGALALAGLLAALAITVIVMPDSVWKQFIVRTVSRATGREASIDGAVRVHLLRLDPDFVIEGFRLANPQWAKGRSMLAVDRIDAQVSLWALFRLRLLFRHVQIVRPIIDLERDASNRANWDFSPPAAAGTGKGGGTTPAHLPLVSQLSVRDGMLTANDAIRKIKFHGSFSIGERPKAAMDRALSLRGSGELNGKPFDLRVDGDPLFDVDPGKPYGFDAAISAADIKLNTHVDIRHAFDLQDMTSKFHITGKDLADVYYLTGLALPNTPPYDVNGTVVRDKLKFSINDLQGRLGDSDIEGILVLDTGPVRPKVTGNLSSKLLNLADLATPLGTQASAELKSDTLAYSTGGSSRVNPRALSGKVAPTSKAPSTVAAADPQANSSGFLLPDADLQVNRVRSMDADVRFDGAAITTEKLPMKKVRFRLRLDNGILALNPLEFTLPEGQFVGSVAINARGTIPQTDIDLKLHDLDLAQFKSKDSATAPISGRMLGRVRLHGTGSSVHKTAASADGDLTVVIPKGDMRAAFAELTGVDVDRGLGLLLTKNGASTEIRCGVGSFHADNGDLKAKALVIDTTHVLVTGGGDINLRNEALNLFLRGQPKELRLVRLRSPIKISGTLLHPVIGLDPAKVLGQAGAAAVLGTLLTPAAAILAFVDGGLAKDANCAALIDQTVQGKQLASANR